MNCKKDEPCVGLGLGGLPVGIGVGLVDVVAGLGQGEEGQEHGDGQSEDAPWHKEWLIYLHFEFHIFYLRAQITGQQILELLSNHESGLEDLS